ncbi:uncharacterized protein [Dysidea avara]|uniref:uncharacterized protein isoform X1 n=1 Tax=Dysidea avara TaxID=196820 RepID=UPI003329C069
MPRRCVVAGCHTEGGMGYSLHGFPSDAAVRSKWVRAVHQQRKDWKGPTTASLICSKHFEPECFNTEGRLYREEMGIPAKKPCLKPDAIPTVFPKPIRSGSSSNSCQVSTQSRRPASERRKQKAIVEELLDTSSTMQSSADDPRSSSPVEDVGSPLLLASTSTGMIPMEIQSGTPTEIQSGADDKDPMTTPGTKSVGTQCDLLAAPPLTLMSHADTTTESSEPEDGDIDDSFQISQDETTTDDDNLQPSTEADPGSTRDEIKYIIFRSALIQLFTHRTLCHSSCPGVITKPKGTYITVKQVCHHCGYQRVWASQPRIKDTPSGNNLLSAAILYSGETATKVLRVLSHMNIACITDRAYYIHQKEYLEPAVISVWDTKQAELLAQCRASGNPLTIGGDGRADSPGHSAKYGSYGIIDLSSNKVIHLELVQSNLVASSNHMEKEGLKNALQFLMEKSINIGALITDRHKQVTKFVSQSYPDIDHPFDVWHVAKGVKKEATKDS